MKIDVLVAGVLAGGLYALIGLGLSLVFGVLRVMNLAHGEFIIGGAYLAWLVVDHVGVDPLVAMPIAMLGMAAIAYPIQRYLLTGLVLASPTAPLVATFGLALIMQAGLQQAFGIDIHSLDAPYASSGMTILGVQVQTVYVISFALAGVLCAGTHVLLNHTRAGSAVRAAA